MTKFFVMLGAQFHTSWNINGMSSARFNVLNKTTGKMEPVIPVGTKWLEKMHMFNAFWSEEFSRPVLGFSGPKLDRMIAMSDDWLDELFTSRWCTVQCCGADVSTIPVASHGGMSDGEVGAVFASPRLGPAKQVMRGLARLLGWMNETNPTVETVGAFGAQALAWGHLLQEHFPEYEFKPYEHFLTCHVWEQMEYYGGVGRLSEIVCEASNAVQKDQMRNHRSGAALTHSQTAYENVTASTDPTHVHRDLLA